MKYAFGKNRVKKVESISAEISSFEHTLHAFEIVEDRINGEQVQSDIEKRRTEENVAFG